MRAQGRVMTISEVHAETHGRFDVELYVETDDKGTVAPVLAAQRIEGGVVTLSFERPDDDAAEELLRRYVIGEIKAAELKKDARELLGL